MRARPAFLGRIVAGVVLSSWIVSCSGVIGLTNKRESSSDLETLVALGWLAAFLNPVHFSLGSKSIVPNTPAVPNYAYVPDGHISMLPDLSGNWMMIWAENSSYRSTGPTQYPESQTTRNPSGQIFGGTGNFNTWDNGGSWLYSVHRISGNNLVGFYHAEDHWYPHTTNDIAWKSIALTTSSDNGITWTAGQQIITAWRTKPGSPAWGGAGDHCVVRDSANNRWVAYYQEIAPSGVASLHMAVSTDATGSVGSWYKWDGVSFSVAGIGGKGAPLPSFSGTEGGNPSVHWNTFLNKWIMVYGGWDGNSYISSSVDMVYWTPPQLLLQPAYSGGRAWYPTIIGDSDTQAGETAKLYYADIKSDLTNRDFVVRSITFAR